jgi:hypothetical protein
MSPLLTTTLFSCPRGRRDVRETMMRREWGTLGEWVGVTADE